MRACPASKARRSRPVGSSNTPAPPHRQRCEIRVAYSRRIIRNSITITTITMLIIIVSTSITTISYHSYYYHYY